ncbi:barstar family protein [Dysgonomonas sp. 520]|uniref:barstar family protein n=1 Tax=Dysgonomonas sp. 520 TaxID=2302931 RepID=UPI0013D00D60|nr:barstar family protein [Dysgonomonas sp. 520]NDW08928.1 ribonuclease inhibitor [Dysgonomonas sp. 520]
MIKTIIINGNNIHDIPSFYEEINRVFMADEDWKIGQSLDALNDMFYGGYGEINGDEEVHLVWTNFEQNRKDLGYELTKSYYQRKLEQPSIFNVDFVKKKLTELENGTGQTYFEIILEIIGEHKNVKLIDSY